MFVDTHGRLSRWERGGGRGRMGEQMVRRAHRKRDRQMGEERGEVAVRRKIRVREAGVATTRRDS